MKKAASLSAGLVAVKGQATPTADFPTRSPPTSSPAKVKNDVPLNFKMSDDFVLSFKRKAVDDRLKLNELLEKCFEAYCERQAK